MLFGQIGDDFIDDFMLPLIVVHTLMIFFMVGLLVVYFFHVLRNEHLENTMKMLWLIVLFMFNWMAMPVYFYLYVWCDPISGPASKIFKAQPQASSRT
jgi:hypothetical protein